MQRSFVVAVVLGLAAVSSTAFADPPATGVVKDRAAFMPQRSWAKLPGKVVAVLLPGGKEVGALDGWGGPADLLVISSGGSSYRKTYVTTIENPQVTNFSVPAGEEGKQVSYPSLSIASPRTVLPWGVTAPYSLVEVTVNSGLGSPAHDCFVATEFKVLDGTKDYPLKVAEVIESLKKRYAEHLKARDIDKAMAEQAVKALKDKKPTGPRELSELMFVTWIPQTDTLQVRFKTKITDGAYTIVNNPGNPRLPIDPRVPPKAGGAAGNSVPFRAAIVRPPILQTKTGTAFGIEVGAAFEVNKKGEVVRIDELPIETFAQQLTSPAVGPVPGPRPIPLPQPVPPRPDL